MRTRFSLRFERLADKVKDPPATVNLDMITSDLLFGLRRLRRSPGEIPAIVLTLAVGVGFVAATWMLVESILLRPLPYPAPEQLIRLWDARPELSGRAITDVQFRALREAADLPARFSIFGGVTAELEVPGREGSSWIQGLRVSGEFFEILDAPPALGRTLRRSDENLEGAPHIVISKRLRIGRSFRPGVGEQLRVNGVGYTVVGVMPEDFHFPDREAQFWIPIVFLPNTVPGVAGSGNRVWHYSAFGRDDGSVSIDALRAQVSALLSSSGSEQPLIRAIGLRDDMTARVRAPLLLMQGAAFLVLCLAVANAAWLFGWRVRRLRHTLLIMRAVGASPRRLLGTHMMDAAVVSVLSVPAALGIALGVVHLLLAQEHGLVPRAWEAQLSTSTALVTLAAAILSTFLAALPATLSVVRFASRKTAVIAHRAVRGQRRRESVAMTVQAGLVFALAMQAVLMTLVLRDLIGDHVGLGERDLVVSRAAFPADTSIDGRVQAGQFRDLVDSMAAAGIPAAVTTTVPLSGYYNSLNLRTPPNLEQDTTVGLRIVTASYFDLVGLKLIAGRVLTRADAGHGRLVVNDVLARQSLGGIDAAVRTPVVLGAIRNPPSEVVGVVRAVQHVGLLEDPLPELYVLYEDMAHISMTAKHLFFVVSLSSAGADRVQRQAISTVLPDAAIAETFSFSDLLWSGAKETSLLTLGIGIFAGAGMLLLFSGFHGMVGRALAARAPELAIRISLGATPRRVLLESVSAAVGIYTSGLVLGLAFLWVLRRSVRATLFVPEGLQEPNVILVCSAAAVVLAAVVAAACYRPVRRALHIDPVQTLRIE